MKGTGYFSASMRDLSDLQTTDSRALSTRTYRLPGGPKGIEEKNPAVLRAAGSDNDL
jgi:hypothetical protein